MDATMVIPMVEAALLGAGAGAMYGLSQYWKNNQEETWDSMKFFTTVSVGAVVGLASGLTGLTMDAQYQVFIDTGLTVVLQNAFKALWRNHLLPWLQRIIPPPEAPKPSDGVLPGVPF